MTAQDPVMNPPCPGCRSGHGVGRERIGKNGRMVWFCHPCCLVFTGSAHEIAQESDDADRTRIRETYRQMRSRGEG